MLCSVPSAVSIRYVEVQQVATESLGDLAFGS